MSATENQWDAVVIGSGIGGLSAAVLLARLSGKRVLVLERHFRAGGFTHVFSRKSGYHWDVGVHYVGEVSDDDPRETTRISRDVMNVVTGGQLRWNRLPEAFDELVFPDFKFTIRAGRENFRTDLKAAFPHEANAIDQYFADIECALSFFEVLGTRGIAPAPLVVWKRILHPRARRLALQTTGAYLTEHVKDERLRAVLGARWGDYGLPPSQSAFLMHAAVTHHFLEGAYYPIGSARRIAETACDVLRAHGGDVRVRAEVEEILVERGTAVGVRLTNGEVIRAPHVISDAGARNTYLKLLPSTVKLPFRQELETTPSSHTVATLFLGLRESPASLGIGGENYWIHDGLDQDALYARQREAAHGHFPLMFVSFPSQKDPSARSHTGEIVAGVDPEAFGDWKDTGWMKRGQDYAALKTRLVGDMLGKVERHFPGFRALVDYAELSTPLTSEHFTAHPKGEIYGIPVTPQRFQKSYLQVRTPIKNLLLTGADALSPGVVASAQAGLLCAVAATSVLTFSKLSTAARELRLAAPTTSTVTFPSIA
jgi:all-trans-retinol 13,14-reductase